MRRRATISLTAAVVFLAGSGFGTHAAERQDAEAIAATPPAWAQYAAVIKDQVTSWLSADTETARRLRAYVLKTQPAATPIGLRVWADPEGEVTRVDFAPFADDQANADLTALIDGRRLPPPPTDLRWPVRLGVTIAPTVASPDSTA